jgi:biotin--protein ligase
MNSQDIVVYVDKGVSGDALRHTVKSLQKEVDLTSHTLKRLDAEVLIASPWENRTALLIMPGGRDVFYHEALHGAGTHKMRKFVEKGGSYLGLCAGAYFAADLIEFEKGGRLQVCGKRSLELYPGLARGPALGLGKYSYESDQGVEAARISWQEGECLTYFNGGCLFETPDKFPHVQVLSSYVDLEEKPAAVVSCKIGKGEAILSGVHLEFSAASLTRSSPQMDRVLPMLHSAEEKRREIFRALLQRLGLRLK